MLSCFDCCLLPCVNDLLVWYDSGMIVAARAQVQCFYRIEFTVMALLWQLSPGRAVFTKSNFSLILDFWSSSWRKEKRSLDSRRLFIFGRLIFKFRNECCRHRCWWWMWVGGDQTAVERREGGSVHCPWSCKSKSKIIGTQWLSSRIHLTIRYKPLFAFFFYSKKKTNWCECVRAPHHWSLSKFDSSGTS